MRNAIVFLAGAAALLGQPKTGPEPATKVPAFTLPDQAGQQQTLQSVTGPKGLMLVFFRSADW